MCGKLEKDKKQMLSQLQPIIFSPKVFINHLVYMDKYYISRMMGKYQVTWKCGLNL